MGRFVPKTIEPSFSRHVVQSQDLKELLYFLHISIEVECPNVHDHEGKVSDIILN